MHMHVHLQRKVGLTVYRVFYCFCLCRSGQFYNADTDPPTSPVNKHTHIFITQHITYGYINMGVTQSYTPV